MKKDFKKVLASVLFGAVLICIFFISPFVVLEDFDFSPSSFILSTYLLMLLIGITITVANFNSNISKKYCKGNEIIMKKEIKGVIFPYIVAIILFSIGIAINIFLNGGPENAYNMAYSQFEIQQAIYVEKPYIAIFWKIITVVVFFVFQYFNAQGFCNMIFEKLKEKLFKDNKLYRR